MLLDLNQNTVSRLGLEPIKNGDKNGYLFEGCIPAQVSEVEVGSQDYEKGEFAGKNLPVLKIEFTNLKLNSEDPDRFLTHSFKPIGTKVLEPGSTDTYVDRDQKEVLANIVEQWQFIKHFLESLTGSPNYKNISKISKEDFTKYFNLPSAGDVDTRIAAFKAFYTYIAEFINGDGNENKSQILDANGKALPIWVKALPNYDKDPKRNHKYYQISRFIGQGVFEAMKIVNGIPSSPKVIKVKPGESLELTAVGTSAGPAKPGSMSGSTASGSDGVDPEVMKMLMGK